LMLTWPKLEYSLTIWIAFAQGVAVSQAAAELGLANNGQRLNKLKKLYAGHNDQEATELLRRITEEHELFARVRNAVAHAMLIGTSLSEPDSARFLTTRAVPGTQGFMEVCAISFSSFKEEAQFFARRNRHLPGQSMSPDPR